jgi:biopolymer transport protein ExbD
MAMHLVGGSGGRRSRGMPAMAEINVTPFVDVVLVLLVIFMITAHVMDYGVEVKVPQTKAVTSSTKDLPVVVVDSKGEVYLGRDPVKIVDLVSVIHTKYPAQNAVYVRADKQATWDVMSQVTTELGIGKFTLNLVSQPADSGSRH